MEPPYWYYPVRQSLGAALLLAGDLDRAEQTFRASVIRMPNNGWALYGLLQVSSARQDRFASARFEELLDRAWAGDRTMLDLVRL